MRRASIVLLVAAALVAAGCSRVAESVAERVTEEAIERASGGQADIDVSEDQVRIETEEGSFVAGAGSEVPEGFPVPIADGGEVTGSMSISEDGSTQQTVGVRFPLEDGDRVVSFYREWAEGALSDLTTSDADAGGARFVTLDGTLADGTRVSIIISVEDPEVFVTLNTSSP